MIFPTNEHLKIIMYASSFLGLWPVIFQNNPFLKKLYTVYSFCIFRYYQLYILNTLIKLYVILFDEVLVMDELMANLSLSLLDSVVMLRAKAIRTDKVKNLIRKVLFLEEKIMNSKDDKIIKMYNKYVFQSQITTKIYLVIVCIVASLCITRPLYVDDIVKYYPSKNETVISKAWPLSIWFPFNEQNHYVMCYLVHILTAALAGSSVGCTDVFAISLMIFTVGQIRILKIILSNLQEYIEKVKHQLQCSREEASFVTLRECILKHKEIIEYVNEYNEAMRGVMVFDVLESSVQLASIALMLVLTKMTTFNIVFNGQFALLMFIRLLVYYWYANEIMVHSSELGTALYCSKWYEESHQIQKLMLIVMLRCNRELSLQIGPFSVMTLGTFMGILKTTYSYMMVIIR